MYMYWHMFLLLYADQIITTKSTSIKWLLIKQKLRNMFSVRKNFNKKSMKMKNKK